MKGKVAIASGVVVATTLIVVLMCVSPDRAPVETLQATGPKPAQAVPEQAGTAVSIQAGPAAAEPAPASPARLPTEEELAAMEERIADAVDRMPLLLRAVTKSRTLFRKISDEDLAEARGVYVRFLDNFTRIKTARCRWEVYEVLEDGTQRLMRTRDMYWVASPESLKERVEMANEEDDGKVHKTTTVYDGRTWCRWEDGKIVKRGTHWPSAGIYHLYRYEMASIRERVPLILCGYTGCDLDDGSTGYSRLYRDGVGDRFDTATGMLTQEREVNGVPENTYTYQNVNGIWFPSEVRMKWPAPDDGERWMNIRQVYSQVVLNEPVDESLFDLNNPG
ncbi:MAG: hypothetical protein NTZ09_07800 [Candidatus Hydrogenedentes bacterium]|nr:hypothetical protein [Candidatus Hydrogenedentota bacterium]